MPRSEMKISWRVLGLMNTSELAVSSDFFCGRLLIYRKLGQEYCPGFSMTSLFAASVSEVRIFSVASLLPASFSSILFACCTIFSIVAGSSPSAILLIVSCITLSLLQCNQLEDPVLLLLLGSADSLEGLPHVLDVRGLRLLPVPFVQHIKTILDGVLAAAGKLLRNFAPLAAALQVSLEQHNVLSVVPRFSSGDIRIRGLLLDVRVEVVPPALSALLAGPPHSAAQGIEFLCDGRPRVIRALAHDGPEQRVLLRSPGKLGALLGLALRPPVFALGLIAARHQTGDVLPVAGTLRELRFRTVPAEWRRARDAS